MPEWLDLLVQLRTETGKMATLHTHYHRLLSHSSQPAAEGLEMADFICDRFGGEETSGAEMQRALFWLQVRDGGRRGMLGIDKTKGKFLPCLFGFSSKPFFLVEKKHLGFPWNFSRCFMKHSVKRSPPKLQLRI